MTNAPTLPDRLRQKARGERNSVGDLWGDHICEEAAAEIERLRAALSYIAWPVRTFEERAKAEDSRIDGDMAVRLSTDHHFLKDIARRALAT